MFIPLGLLVFFSGGYRLYLFSSSQHGKLVFSGQILDRGSLLEYCVLFLHWVPLNLLILSVFCLICSFSLFKKMLLCGGREVGYKEH